MILHIDRRVYLHWIRNVRRGLIARTRIIDFLDSENWALATAISGEIGLTRNTVIYHLQNMEKERIVVRNPEGAGWRLDKFTQAQLADFLSEPRKKKRKIKKS